MTLTSFIQSKLSGFREAIPAAPSVVFGAAFGVFFHLVTLSSIAVPVTAWSQNEPQERGASALEKQLQRAQYLKELEYQAAVLERQMRIAQVQETIDKTLGYNETVMDGSKKKSTSKQKIKMPLPTIVILSNSMVTFQFEDGSTGGYRTGDTLPTGHTLVAVSMVYGATLERDGEKTVIDYEWK